MSEETVHIAGIDLPKQLYDAAKNDDLVIFVGAGVSRQSNIPDFAELTDEILEGVTNNYSEDLSHSEKLERAELDGIDIRRETKRIIEEKNTGPTTPHHKIIDFFRKKTMRVVTTNFDLNLTEAAKEKQITHKPYYQPALPTGDSFDGIGYLHGAVSEDGSKLIITEKDFARAYLKYGRQTAFIRELFSKFTVLVIGYSYDDKIFQFLTKSDDFRSKKYVFVSNKDYQQDPQKWEALNLSAIPYDTANQHRQLWNVISTWGDFINRQPSEHQSEIQRIARKRGKLTQQDSDYIRCCLERPDLAQCFFQHAKTERWLKWAYDNNILDIFFKIDFQLSEVERLTIFWFSENFVVKNYNLALEIMKDKGAGQLNPHLVDMIVLAFHRAPPRAVFSQWIHIILPSANFLPRDHISYILLKCRIPQDSDIALLLLNKLTLPTYLKNTGRSDSTEYWVREIWEEKFKPKIASIAFEIEPLIAHHLKLHELQERTRYNLYPAIDISRPAIEESPHSFGHDLVHALIDIARDIMDYFTAKQPQIATETIERWYQQKTVILKRLSVYGMTRHAGLSASEKLSWLLAKKELLRLTLRHENFKLIQGIYSHLNEAERERLLAAAEREAKKDYSLYNFTNWLNRADPDCPLAKAKLEELQQKNPNFGPRDDPDIGSHMPTQGGFISPISPVSVENLIKMNMADAAELLDTYEGERGFDKPEREGLVNTLRKAVKEHFDWSLKLAQELASQNIWQKDIWQCILWSWSENENLTTDNANSVIKFILKNTSLHVHHYEVARFLSSHDKKLYEADNDEKRSVRLAHIIKDIAFSDKAVGKVVISDDVPDWWAEAINSTGHYICYFLIRVFGEKYWKTKQERQKLDEFFASFITSDSYSAQMGRITLAHYLLFFFDVDKEWTRDTILPLFDWTINTSDALQSWQAYLYRARWSKELFDDLMNLHQKTFTHFKGLGRLRDNYCQHVAGFTLYCVIFDEHDPLETGWLRAFIKHCEEEDLAAFAKGIYAFLRNNEEVQENSSLVWKKLLLPYWDQRISGKPKTLCKSEFRWMIEWCLHLDSDFGDCVEKIIEADENNNLLGINRNQDTNIFNKLKDSDVLQNHPESAGRLILHLLLKQHISHWDWRHLEQIVKTIALSGCPRQTVVEIIEEALSLGFSGASELRDELESP